MDNEKAMSILISVILLILFLVFTAQGIYYLVVQNRNNLPDKMKTIGIFNIIIGVFSLGFSIFHFIKS